MFETRLGNVDVTRTYGLDLPGEDRGIDGRRCVVSLDGADRVRSVQGCIVSWGGHSLDVTVDGCASIESLGAATAVFRASGQRNRASSLARERWRYTDLEQKLSLIVYRPGPEGNESRWVQLRREP